MASNTINITAEMMHLIKARDEAREAAKGVLYDVPLREDKDFWVSVYPWLADDKGEVK